MLRINTRRVGRGFVCVEDGDFKVGDGKRVSGY